MITTIAHSATTLDVPDLVPARMLNEFCYCPRLGYLEWAQGEFADNLETLEGTFGHRRVDRPTRVSLPAPDDQPADNPYENAPKLHARSLMLSAPNEHLIAKMDLLELDGTVATPVDYKRGRAPDLPEGAWEPERVQLCAQGLILREAGYECHQGVLYFIASKRRVTIEFDDELVARTRELVVQFRERAAAGEAPAPLVDSPKCPRCSLVGICLPDETNLLSRTQEPDYVRRLLPARSDALPLYVQEQGARIGKTGDRLQIKKHDQVLQDVRIIDVSQVCLLGNVQFSAQALRELAVRGIPVCHFSYGGWFYATTHGMTHKNVELRIRQFHAFDDPEQAVKLARAMIVGKIKNCRTLLRRHLQSDPENVVGQLAELARKAARIANAESLLGIEGTAAKIYFERFGSLFKRDTGFTLNGRNRRPPTDPVNATLSFVYSLLVKELTVTAQAVGFDPMLGLYHRPRYGRPSLALDLAEEFRPLIADSVTLTLINNGELSQQSFICRAGAVALTTAGRRAVIAAFERRLDTLVTHPIFGYRISYRRVLEVQCRLLARALTGEIPCYPAFCTR